MRLFWIIPILLFLLTGCALPSADPCRPAAIEDEIDAFNALYVRWFDAMDIAEHAPRIALSPEIAQLQAIRREAMTLEVPECLEPAQAAMLNFMQSFIDGYLGFMAGDGDAEAHFEQAYLHLDTFIAAMQEYGGWPDLDEEASPGTSG